jgi:hypothetical protein
VVIVGTVEVARTLPDRDLSDQFLARGVEAALKLLDDLSSSDAGAAPARRCAVAAS